MKNTNSLWDAAEEIRSSHLVLLGTEPGRKGGTFVSLKGGGLGFADEAKLQNDFAALIRQMGLTVVWNGSSLKETGWGDKVALKAIVREDIVTVKEKIFSAFAVECEGRKYICRWRRNERPQRKYRGIRHLDVAVKKYYGIEWISVPYEREDWELKNGESFADKAP